MSQARDEPSGSAPARRIIIDALAARYGGTAYATVQLARHLAASPKVSAVVVVARSGSIVERGLADEDSVSCVSLPAAHHLELIRRLAWETFGLPSLVRRERCDVVISMSGMLPRMPDCRLVCLVGNPVMYESRTVANVLRRWAVRRTVRKAEFLAAPSRPMADLVSASAERPCATLPWGVDHEIFSPAASPGPEILCVADFYAHKRHDILLAAWCLLPAPRPRLHLVGNPNVDPRAYARVLARIETLGAGGSITLESGVSRDRLVRAYQSARVFVLPSEHESFCLPLAESMACGVPAVVRGIRSLRETGGAGARYLEVDDPAEWSVVIKRLVEDDPEHDLARGLAIRAASQFTWRRCAEAVAARF